MIKALSFAAAAATLLGTGAAQAQTHGYGDSYSYLPPPPHAAEQRREYRVETRERGEGLTLVGADAGFTVLGVHLGGAVKVKLGLDDSVRLHHRKMIKRWSGGPAYERREYRDYREEGPPAHPDMSERGRW